MENYKKQATDFLHKWNLKFTCQKSVPQVEPLWYKKGEKHGFSYLITLFNGNNKKTYSFMFWNSVHNANIGKTPNAYDVLACLDTYTDSDTSFDDFCSEFGYDTDSRIAEKTYKAVIKQTKALKDLLPTEALEELNQIQ